MVLDLMKLINTFLSEAKSDSSFELYNEAGLQYELAFYLRHKFGETYQIQLERSIYDVFDNPHNEVFAKKEMDIYIFKDDHSEQYCIELKFPTKGAFPRRMYHTLEDVKFLEQLKNNAGFTQVGLLFITNQTGFKWARTDKASGIYKMFRDEHCLSRLSYDNTPHFIRESKDFKPLNINGKYEFNWETFRKAYHYFTICI